MAGFYMLAGTVLTDKSLLEMNHFLSENQIQSTLFKEELKLNLDARIKFRPGFAHELILVGDSMERDRLIRDSQQLCELLARHQISHAIEIYDTNNQLIHEQGYTD